MSLQVPLVTSLTFRSRGGPGRSAGRQETFILFLHLTFTMFLSSKHTTHTSTLNVTVHKINKSSDFLRTEHIDSDFDHLVSSGTLGVDDVSAGVVQFAVRDHNYRGCVGGVDLRGSTRIM